MRATKFSGSMDTKFQKAKKDFNKSVKELREINERFKEYVREHSLSASFVSTSSEDRRNTGDHVEMHDVFSSQLSSKFQDDNYEQIANEEREQEVEGLPS